MAKNKATMNGIDEHDYEMDIVHRVKKPEN